MIFNLKTSRYIVFVKSDESLRRVMLYKKEALLIGLVFKMDTAL